MVRSMEYEVRLHPTVIKFLDSLQTKERNLCTTSLKNLKDNPFESRSGTDIKKSYIAFVLGSAGSNILLKRIR